MSFLKPKNIIDEGDTVIIYLSANAMYAIDVVPKMSNKNGDVIDNVFQTSFGSLKVKDLIGVAYGSKILLSKGWAYALQPNPDMWTQTLPHRTQIIYTPDISMILFQLDIRPGSIVIESGTGSGSLSHNFLRALKPSGHLHTFDFHEARVIQAREEFRKHGLESFVTVYHRDVCLNGFDPQLDGKADAIFLDLPSPNTVVPAAVRAMSPKGGRFCSFSPCIEQSQRLCAALDEHGFVEIQSMEILQQEEVVKSKTYSMVEFEFLKEKNKDLPDIDKLTEEEMNNSIPPVEETKILTSSAPSTIPGHTGYLTFATLAPINYR